MNYRKKIIKNLTSGNDVLSNELEKFFDSYENGDGSGYKDVEKLYGLVQSQLGSIRTTFNDSKKKGSFYYDLINHKVFLDPISFNPVGNSLESLGGMLHETLHIYFSKGVEGTQDLVFNKERPGFNTLVNIFEDLRINYMSENFIEDGQNLIKTTYIRSFNENKDWIVKEQEKIKENRIGSLMNYSIGYGLSLIGDGTTRKELKDKSDELKEIEKVFPDECRMIRDFMKYELKKYGNFNKIKNSIRKTFADFIDDLYENIYVPIFEEDFKENNQKQEQKDPFGGEMGDSNQGGGNGDDEGDSSDGEGSNGGENGEKGGEDGEDEGKSNKKGDDDGEKGDEGSSLEDGKKDVDDGGENEFEGCVEKSKNKSFSDSEGGDSEDDSDSYSNSLSEGKSKEKEVSKYDNKDYEEMVMRNSGVIQDLYSKLFTIFQKRKELILEGFNKGRTVSGNRILRNNLDIISGKMRKDELFKKAFKRKEKQGKKALNIVGLALDDSGSMCGDKMDTLKESSVVIVETLKRLGVLFSIEAFHTKKIYDGNVYSKDYESVASMGSAYCNDEVGVLTRTKEHLNRFVKSSVGFEEVNGLCFFITDGLSSGEEKIKILVEEMKREDIKVICIGLFDTEEEIEHVKKSFDYIYGVGNHHFVKEIKELPGVLFDLVKKNIR